MTEREKIKHLNMERKRKENELALIRECTFKPKTTKSHKQAQLELQSV